MGSSHCTLAKLDHDGVHGMQRKRFVRKRRGQAMQCVEEGLVLHGLRGLPKRHAWPEADTRKRVKFQQAHRRKTKPEKHGRAMKASETGQEPITEPVPESSQRYPA